LVISLARLKDTILGSVGGVVGAPDAVELVFAELGRIGTARVANLEAERIVSEEVVPLDNMLKLAAKGIREQDSSERVTAVVSTVWVEFSSIVILLDINLGLIEETDKLDVVRSPHPLETGEGPLWNNASTVTRLRAPSDHRTLSVADARIRGIGTPKAEVFDGVEVAGLAARLRALSLFVADIVPILAASHEVSIGVDLLWQISRRGEMLLCQRDFRVNSIWILCINSQSRKEDGEEKGARRHY